MQSPSGHPGIAATITVIPVTVGDNPPIGAGTTNNGELWWESDTGDLYVYYNDGDSSQWVMANSGGRGLTGDKGETGDKGSQGDKGDAIKGDKGNKGDINVINSNADDRVITGSDTPGELNAESKLTFDSDNAVSYTHLTLPTSDLV